MTSPSTRPFAVNEREYRPPPRPIVVICIDGSADEYLDAASDRDATPNLRRLAAQGARGMARSALPSFTNVNNSSIVTGVPPSVHGISGNFFLDPTSGEEVMMNSSQYLRAPTILAAAIDAGRRVAMVTAKEKLRNLLSKDFAHTRGFRGIAFSSEKARDARRSTHGIDDVESLVGAPTPEIYSAEASLYVVRAGVALLERREADFLYLSLTDWLQHKYGPDAPEAIEFYAALDVEIGRLLALDAVVGITADHGMCWKTQEDGSPRVVWLEDEIRARSRIAARVILPITDPYVVHHGALGSFAVVHLDDPSRSDELAGILRSIPGVTEVHTREDAARVLELPADRIGDVVALSARDVVLGRSPEAHDLGAVARGLRSHGGRYEEMVPWLVSEPLSERGATLARGDLRNFDIFDLTVNHAR